MSRARTHAITIHVDFSGTVAADLYAEPASHRAARVFDVFLSRSMMIS